MRKKILLVNKSFTTGGIQSSMINMANELSKYYDIEIFVFNPEGSMKDRLNSEVKILEPCWEVRAIGMSMRESFKSKDVRIILFRIYCALACKISNNKKCIKKAFSRQKKLGTYDLAIAYHHEQKINTVTAGFSRFIISRVKAKRKAAWIHYDSSSIDLDDSYNINIYNKLDYVIGVSKSVIQAFVNKNHALKTKTDYCYNFMDYDNIIAKSNEEVDEDFDNSFVNFFTACRLTKEKGLLRAIDAFAEIAQVNSNFRWYIAGDGPEYENIVKKIISLNLENNIIMMGNKKNPYKYMKKSDMVISVSYHEAASMVIKEALTLKVPVLSTDTLSAAELLHNGELGMICDNSEYGIREGLMQVIQNRQLLNDYIIKMNEIIISNDESFEKICELMK